MARTKVAAAHWDGVVETLHLNIAKSSQKCGLSWSVVKKMRMILYGKMNPNNRMRPPLHILDQIPVDQTSASLDIRAVTQAEITREADKANRINETAPVSVKKVYTRMDTAQLRLIAQGLDLTVRESAEKLGMSGSTVKAWRSILLLRTQPGKYQLGRVSRSSIARLRAEFGLVQDKDKVKVRPVAVDAQGFPTHTIEVATIVNDLVEIAQRLEQLAPAFAEAEQATARLESIRQSLGVN